MVRRLRIAVIGAGGTGSIECQQLAHLGAVWITVIDPDLVEETNLNRLVGSIPSDVGRPKVEVAARMIRTINPQATVIPLRADIVDEDVAKLIATFDFVLLCTDSCKPGSGEPGRLSVSGPRDRHGRQHHGGGRCRHAYHRQGPDARSWTSMPHMLECAQQRGDQAGDADTGAAGADPTFRGREPQPAVLSINSTVSSLAMTMMLGAVTPVPVKPRYQIYDGIRGRVKEMAVAVQPHCVVCSPMGAFAKGPTWDLPVRPASREGNDK
jgi:hypothetical protein